MACWEDAPAETKPSKAAPCSGELGRTEVSPIGAMGAKSGAAWRRQP